MQKIRNFFNPTVGVFSIPQMTTFLGDPRGIELFLDDNSLDVNVQNAIPAGIPDKDEVKRIFSFYAAANEFQKDGSASPMVLEYNTRLNPGESNKKFYDDIKLGLEKAKAQREDRSKNNKTPITAIEVGGVLYVDNALPLFYKLKISKPGLTDAISEVRFYATDGNALTDSEKRAAQRLMAGLRIVAPGYEDIAAGSAAPAVPKKPIDATNPAMEAMTEEFNGLFAAATQSGNHDPRVGFKGGVAFTYDKTVVTALGPPTPPVSNFDLNGSPNKATIDAVFADSKFRIPKIIHEISNGNRAIDIGLKKRFPSFFRPTVDNDRIATLAIKKVLGAQQAASYVGFSEFDTKLKELVETTKTISVPAVWAEGNDANLLSRNKQAFIAQLSKDLKPVSLDNPPVAIVRKIWTSYIKLPFRQATAWVSRKFVYRPIPKDNTLLKLLVWRRNNVISDITKKLEDPYAKISDAKKRKYANQLRYWEDKIMQEMGRSTVGFLARNEYMQKDTGNNTLFKKFFSRSGISRISFQREAFGLSKWGRLRPLDDTRLGTAMSLVGDLLAPDISINELKKIYGGVGGIDVALAVQTAKAVVGAQMNNDGALKGRLKVIASTFKNAKTGQDIYNYKTALRAEADTQNAYLATEINKALVEEQLSQFMSQQIASLNYGQQVTAEFFTDALLNNGQPVDPAHIKNHIETAETAAKEALKAMLQPSNDYFIASAMNNIGTLAAQTPPTLDNLKDEYNRVFKATLQQELQAYSFDERPILVREAKKYAEDAKGIPADRKDDFVTTAEGFVAAAGPLQERVTDNTLAYLFEKPTAPQLNPREEKIKALRVQIDAERDKIVANNPAARTSTEFLAEHRNDRAERNYQRIIQNWVAEARNKSTEKLAIFRQQRFVNGRLENTEIPDLTPEKVTKLERDFIEQLRTLERSAIDAQNKVDGNGNPTRTPEKLREAVEKKITEIQGHYETDYQLARTTDLDKADPTVTINHDALKRKYRTVIQTLETDVFALQTNGNRTLHSWVKDKVFEPDPVVPGHNKEVEVDVMTDQLLGTIERKIDTFDGAKTIEDQQKDVQKIDADIKKSLVESIAKHYEDIAKNALPQQAGAGVVTLPAAAGRLAKTDFKHYEKAAYRPFIKEGNRLIFADRDNLKGIFETNTMQSPEMRALTEEFGRYGITEFGPQAKSDRLWAKFNTDLQEYTLSKKEELIEALVVHHMDGDYWTTKYGKEVRKMLDDVKKSFFAELNALKDRAKNEKKSRIEHADRSVALDALVERGITELDNNITGGLPAYIVPGAQTPLAPTHPARAAIKGVVVKMLLDQGVELVPNGFGANANGIVDTISNNAATNETYKRTFFEPGVLSRFTVDPIALLTHLNAAANQEGSKYRKLEALFPGSGATLDFTNITIDAANKLSGQYVIGQVNHKIQAKIQEIVQLPANANKVVQMNGGQIQFVTKAHYQAGLINAEITQIFNTSVRNRRASAADQQTAQDAFTARAQDLFNTPAKTALLPFPDPTATINALVNRPDGQTETQVIDAQNRNLIRAIEALVRGLLAQPPQHIAGHRASPAGGARGGDRPPGSRAGP